MLLLATAVAVAAVAVAAGAVQTAGATPATPPTPPPAVLTITHEWTQVLPDTGHPIAQSSPTVVTFPGGPAVVVGDRTGHLYAYYLATGTPVPGWPVTVGAPVDSTPSVAPGGGEVFIGSGNAAHPTTPLGGYRAVSPEGKVLWYSRVTSPATDTRPVYGVQASLTVGTLEGTTAVVAGSLDQEEYALDAADGSTLPGWPFFTSDSVFSTAAFADLYGTGSTELVEGGDQTGGFGQGQHYTTGGHLRILNDRGGLICDDATDQTVDSSPAVGNFLPGGHPGIVVGTGSFFPDASDTGMVLAFDGSCNLQWSTKLDGATTSSPALADVLGNGQLQVVEGTATTSTLHHGSVWVLDSTTGEPLWHATATGGVIGSVVTADLSGDGYQDLLVPTTDGLDIFDGRTGTQLAVLNGTASTGGLAGLGTLGFQNSPLVTTDANGSIGITVAGYGGPAHGTGYIEHYQIGGNGSLAVGPGSWPEFHHDPQLTGYAGGSPASTPACDVPSAAFAGYRLVAADGGIFAFTAPFCGSTGNLTLNAPIVGMAAAPTTGGYWLVAADGGVFAYGGAHFYGSMGGRPLNQPIVGMAATPDGKGYWLVAADGGVFAYGDAQFHGSMGGKPLNAPIVGIAATADGLGYRLVAADGGVFAFGPSAQFFGSMGGRPLNQPIVGMADDVASGGYWLVAADGGVFAFQAPFLGSTGSIPLVEPVVGMSASDNGTGYCLVAADGGVFAFGTATFDGSMGGTPLNEPIVGAA